MTETEEASPKKKSSTDYEVAYLKSFPDDFSKFKGLIDDFLCTVQAKSKILDIGCSNGSHVAYLLNQGFDAFGIDISLTMIEEAKKHVPSERLFLMDMHTMEDLGESTFDAVLSITSMLYANKEYLPRVLKQVHRLLKPGGKFLLMMLEGEGDGLIKHSNGESEVVTYTTFYKVDELKDRVKAGGFKIDQEQLTNLVVSSHQEISLFCTKA